MSELRLEIKNIHKSYTETKQLEEEHCIYIIHEREFIKTGENIYKIGRSTNFKNRWGDYPKGSTLKYFSICDDSVKHEKILLKMYDKVFKQRTDIGSEYFEGNVLEMVKLNDMYLSDSDMMSRIFE